MKLIFAVLYVSLNDGPYTLLQNGSFFYILYNFTMNLFDVGTAQSLRVSKALVIIIIISLLIIVSRRYTFHINIAKTRMQKDVRQV